MLTVDVDESPQPKPRRGGGRSGRARRLSTEARSRPASAIVTRSIPPYEPFGEDSLAALEAQADWILSEVGVEFRGDPEALALFRDAGVDVRGERVRFAPGEARALAATAPRSFRMEGRDPASSIEIGGDHLVLMPGYGSPFVTDLENGRRYATIADFERFVRLAYASPWLQHSGGVVCEPVDLPVNKRHLDMNYAHLRYSTKPFMGAVAAPDRAADSIEMARIVFGADFLRSNCVIQANVNVNSALVYDGPMSQALRIYAEAGQCVAISPAIFGGAMGPVTPAAVAAQTHAEVLVGVALTQLVRKGAPVVYGSFHSTMNLKSGALTFGTPEANLITFALGQLARRLGVPVRAGGGQVTSSNVADAQAMQDSTSAMTAAVLAGSNQVWHAAGWLEGGLTMGYEKFVMDLDHCGMLLRMVRGIEVDDSTLAQDAYREAGPGDAFFGASHTLTHFKTANYVSELPEGGPFETWRENGSETLDRRAARRWKQMLADYAAPTIDPGVDEALRDFVDRKKSAAPDQWH